MANIFSVQDGNWGDTSTWDGGTVPTSADYVTINHTVTIKSDAVANSIVINNGSLLGSDVNNTYSLTVNTITMNRKLTDDRTVRLDGLNLIIARPGISCQKVGEDGFPSTVGVVENANHRYIIVDDPGMYGFSATMQDIKPEGGYARAWARKISNSVRYLTVSVHIQSNKAHNIGDLYRMAELPFQVLAVTNSCAIKGYIEAIAPVDSVGKEYRTFRVTIAEGSGA